MTNILPEKIAIFPLSNAIFFPKTILPLNIFEKRYIQMINDCIKNDRLFGMIQPKVKKNSEIKVYTVGCLGKITSFNETQDKRFVISLSGISRFKIKEEIFSNKLYRQFVVDYSDFKNDLNKKTTNKKVSDIKNLLNKIKILFKKKNYLIDWSELEKLSFNQLIYTICMISPFSIEEKQKLLETVEIEDSLNTLEEIVSFNLLDNFDNKTIQ